MALFVHVQHDHFHNVADLDHLAGMVQAPVADLGNMHQAVLMDADVHENAEVNDVAHRAGQLHAGL